MQRRYTIITVGVLAAMAVLGTARADVLREGFQNPPREFSMVPLWSWNGTLDRDELRFQIDEFVDKGVYGAFMHARAGIDSSETPYFSEGWWDAIAFCVEYGESVGFSPWIYDEDKWPSGAAGGRTMERNPERNSQKTLHRIEQRITGPQKVDVSIPGARYVVAAKVVEDGGLDPDSMVDLSRFNHEADTQSIPWTCPDGEWLIAGYVFGPYGHGVNYLNKNTVRDFIDITHEAYASRIGDAFGTTVPGVFFDEIMNDAGKDPEQVVWAEGFEERFREMKGYDIAPLLLALTYDTGPRTPVIRCDYYDVYTTLYEEAWFEQISDWCADHNLMLCGHTIEELNRYITQGDYMRTERHLQIPTTDNEDFRYTWPRTIGAWKPKQLASIAQLYEKPRAAVEAMGGAGWSFTLDSGRYGFNMLAAYGIDFYISHLFHYAQDTPTQVGDWPNSWFFRNPYWKYFKTFADHGSRISYVVRGSTPVVDVAILYPQANQWSGNGPGTTQATMETLVAAQIDADLIDTDSLQRVDIHDGQLNVGKLLFRAIIVPGVQCIRTSELEKIAAFADAGGLVIVHDRFPTASMEHGRDDPALQPLVERLQRAGVEPEPLETTVTHLARAIGRDVAIPDNPASPLRYRHVRRDGLDVYWIANGSRKGGEWHIRFRTIGRPERWQPEDGSITPIGEIVRDGEYTECPMRLDAWQGCFIVFDPAQMPDQGGVQVADTNLEGMRVVTADKNGVVVSGLLPSGESSAKARVRVVDREGNESFVEGQRAVAAAPETIVLDGGWEFLPVDHQLDHDWRIDVASTDLDLPVMRVRWEQDNGPVASDWEDPALDDRDWREIKVLDSMHPDAGADRYRTRWDGQFISYYPYTPFDVEEFFVPVLGGKGLSCRTSVQLPPEASGGWIAVVCPSPFQVNLNDEPVGTGPGETDASVFEFTSVRPGESVIEIVADDAPALMAEGAFETEYGEPIRFHTDDSWQTRIEGRDWIDAWVYVSPPEKPYGEPAHPYRKQLPDVVWYRQTLPPGVVSIYEPEIEGSWNAWLGGALLSFTNGKTPIATGTDARVLALRVKLGENERGLMKPIRVRCELSSQRLGSWTGQNLAWYSGRALYTKEFTLDSAYCEEGVTLTLDLGKVCYNTEVWMNGTLVATRVWPPYRVDVTDHVKVGKNELTVVVANLLANRMHWDIFDDAKTNLIFRRWHDSVLMRDAWCFESGLVGPVRVEPYRRVALTISEPTHD